MPTWTVCSGFIIACVILLQWPRPHLDSEAVRLAGNSREPSLSCRCSEQSTATLLAIQHLQAGEALDVSSISGMDADEMPLRSTGRGQRIRFQATRLRRADGGCETARDQAQCTILLDCRSDNVLYSYRRASPDFDVTVSR